MCLIPILLRQNVDVDVDVGVDADADVEDEMQDNLPGIGNTQMEKAPSQFQVMMHCW